MPIFKIFDSIYCRFVFLGALGISYFLVPQRIFNSVYWPLGIVFMVLSALLVTCMVKNIKDRIRVARTYKSSILGILALAFGAASLQFCGVGAFICSPTWGMALVAALIPELAFPMLTHFAIPIFILSIFFQVISLYLMGCFKRLKVK